MGLIGLGGLFLVAHGIPKVWVALLWTPVQEVHDSSVWAALLTHPDSDRVLLTLSLPAVGMAVLHNRGKLSASGFEQVLGDWLRSPCIGVHGERHLLFVRAYGLNRQNGAAEKDVIVSEFQGKWAITVLQEWFHEQVQPAWVCTIARRDSTVVNVSPALTSTHIITFILYRRE